MDSLIKLLKSAKETVGIDSAAYYNSGKLIYRTSDADEDFSFSCTEKEITQDGCVTVIPLNGGITVVLCGSGEIYYNYAQLIKAAVNSVDIKKELTNEEKLKLYLSGELDEEHAEELIAKYKNTFDSYVLTLTTDSVPKLKELKNFLDAMRERGDLVIVCGSTQMAFIKKCGEDDEYQSATDFALTLYDNIKEELRINVVINVGGTVHSFSDLPLLYQRCELAYTFGEMLNPKEKVHSYKEYVMIKMLYDIPLESLNRYLNAVLDSESSEIFEDSELMTTADEFFKNSLNISETSRSMYMHRNTLIYRLDKIEKSTGLNLRHFNDAMAFRLITVLNKLVKNKNGEDYGL